MTLQRVEWTAENLQTLRDGAAAGLTTQQVSDLIGGDCTRFAVLGRAARMGVKFGQHPGQARLKPEKAKPRPVPPRPPKPDRTLGSELMATAEAIASRVQACRWPIGDPQQKGFRFCGETSIGKKPYCAEHCQAAYTTQPQAPVNHREALRPGQTSLWR